MVEEWSLRGDVGRWRWVTGVGVVAVLAGAVIVLSLQDEEPIVTTTESIRTTTSQIEVTTTTEASTSTTTAEQRQAEVEELLKDLWFGWFDAIYRKDPDALWQVVATTRNHDAGVAAMETMGFIAAPARDGVQIAEFRVLLDRSDCLVVENSVDMTAFRGVVGGSTVSVLWPDDRYGFRFATSWQYANDLWLQDCDDLEREVTP